MHRKTLASGILLLFIGSILSPIALGFKLQQQSRGDILYVGGSGPGNYTKIQDAIDNASDGDTVFVYSGIYFEQVVVDKSLSLIGESRTSTVVDGGNSGDVITIKHDHTLLKNFTIQNGGYYPFYAVVKLTSNYNTISNNTVLHAFHGIWLDNSDFNQVSGNYVTLSGYGGICLKYQSEYNLISQNIIYAAGGGGGIQFEGSNNNTISDNSVSYTQTGIQMGDASLNTIEHNIFCNNSLGVYLTNSYNNVFNYNTIETNTNYGVFIYDAHNNVIYHNNFMNNGCNALDYGNNTWYNGYPSGGNFWDDYIGVDIFYGPNQTIPGPDGIGDSPYPLSGTNDEDRYPLMEPYGMTILAVGNSPGLFKFSFQIKNIGNHTAFNVQWTIRFNGGFIVLGRDSSGGVEKPLLPNEEILVSSGLFLFGFGSILIKMAVWADNAPRSESTVKGLLFLLFLLITP